MTHPWAKHRGLPALRRNQTQRALVLPEAPADTAGSIGSFVFSPSFSVITVFLGVGGPPGCLGPCNGRKLNIQTNPLRIPLIRDWVQVWEATDPLSLPPGKTYKIKQSEIQ